MKSVWEASANNLPSKKTKPDGDIKTDVLVIGGGMAGILTAHRLKEAGVDNPAKKGIRR